MSHDPVITQLIELAGELPDVAVLWLYSSRARGTQREDSDYDLAVAFSSFINNDPLEVRLRPELLAMDWRRRLELPEQALSIIDINQVGIPLASQVIQAGVVLYCRDLRRLFTEEKRIWSRMELDVLPFLR